MNFIFVTTKYHIFFLFTIYFFRIYMLSNLLYCLYRPWSLVEQYCIPYFHFYNSVVCWRLSTIIEQNIHVSIHRLFISQRIKKFIKFFSIIFWRLITVRISDIFFFSRDSSFLIHRTDKRISLQNFFFGLIDGEFLKIGMRKTMISDMMSHLDYLD